MTTIDLTPTILNEADDNIDDANMTNEDDIRGDFMCIDDLKTLGEKDYPHNKDAWMHDIVVGIVNGKTIDFSRVEHIKPNYPGEGTFFLLDGTKESYNTFEKERNIMLNEGRNWRTGGYGGTGRSYRSFGEIGAPRGKAISWFAISDIDPKAKGKMYDWRMGPSNFPFKDLLYPERNYKIGTTVLRSKFLKAGDESGVKYIAVPSYFDAIKNNDQEAINLMTSLGIPLDLTFGKDPNDDYSSTYTSKAN